MKNDKLVDIGIAIPVLTFFAIIGIYYHELGYFSILNIPFEYIRIEPFSNVNLLFQVLFLILPLYVIIEILMTIDHHWQKLNWIIKIIIIILVSYFEFFYIPRFTNIYDVVLGNETFGIAYLLFLLGLFFLPTKDSINFKAYKYIKINYGKYISPILIIAPLISYMSFTFGLIDGENKIEKGFTLFKGNPEKVLLKTYNDLNIYALLDNSNNSQIQYLIMSNKERSDTALYNTARIINNNNKMKVIYGSDFSFP